MEKPDALRLADRLEGDFIRSKTMVDAAAELRRLHAENELLASAADKLRMSHSEERRELLRQRDQATAQRDALLEQRDELRRALEIIAVGDATNPQAQAAEELIALGYWRDIPEARAAIKMVEGEKNHG
jgi:hypothetical protein